MSPIKNKLMYLLILFVYPFVQTDAQTFPNWTWAKAGLGLGNDKGESISTDSLGNCYVTGSYQGPSIIFGTDTITDPAAHNFFLVKYDSLGNKIWTRKASNSVYSYGTCVSTDKLGNSYVTGYCTNGGPITFGSITLTTNNSGDGTAFIVKYDATGNALWAKTLGTLNSIGSLDVIVNNAIDAQGNVYIVAPFESTSSPNFLIKLNSSGNTVWSKTIPGGGFAPVFSYPNVCTDTTGNCYVTGIFAINTSSITFGTITLNGGGGDLFIVKYDNAGNEVWVKKDGNGGLNYSRPSISTDAAENVFVSGILFSTYATFDTVLLDNSIGNSTYDSWLVKYNSLGQFRWVKQIGVPNYDELAYCHKTDLLGNTYITGQFSYFISFGTISLYSPTNVNIFVVKYDSVGNSQWAQHASGGGTDYGKGIAYSPQKSVYVTGTFGSPNCNFSSTTLTNLDTLNNGDIFIAKINNPMSIPTALEDEHLTSALSISPNPFTNSTTISTHDLKDATLTIRNYLGQIVKQEKHLSGNSFTIQRSNLSAGLYFVQLTENNNLRGTGKLIIAEK